MRALFVGSVLLGAAALVGQVQAAELDFSTCAIPAAPAIPDGNAVGEEELVAAIGGFKAYQADNQKARECLDGVKASAGAEGLTEEQTTAHTDAYNSTVDAEQRAGEALNAAIRAYKAKNPG